MIGAVLVLAVTLVVLAPLAAWIGRHRAGSRGAPASSERAVIDLVAGAAPRVVAAGADPLVSERATRTLQWLAPLLASVPVITAFAVIPFGGTYDFGARAVSLVAADVDWGVLYVLAVVFLAGFGAVLASWTTAGPRSPLGAGHAMTQTMSYGVALGFSLVPVFMLYGTLRLTDMGAAQQTSIGLAGLLRSIGVGGLPSALDWISLPAWGLFLNPPAFVLFLLSIMAATRRPPFDRPESGIEMYALAVNGYSSMGQGIARLAEYVQVAVIAGLTTAIFLGGWTIPWLPQQTIISSIEPYYGAGFATAICLLLHIACFVVKLAFVIDLQVRLREHFARFDYAHTMDLCWKVVLPLALLNILVTATALVAFGPAGSP